MTETTKGIGGNKLSISQSLIKNYWAYKEGNFCGEALYRMNIMHEAEFEPSDAMKMGHYFEFLCTGATLRDGTSPEMPATKAGKPTAGALKMQVQADRFKKLVKKEDITISKTGVVVEHFPKGASFKLKGIYDIMGLVGEEGAIIDIKSSGLIGNEWEAYGWHKGTFNMRKQLTIQVIFYKYLAWKKFGVKDMPFYFIVHSSTNEIDSIFWKVDVADFEVAMNHFEDMVFEIAEEIETEMEFGFTPYPSVKRCGKCALKDDCAHMIETAQLETVIIDGIFE